MPIQLTTTGDSSKRRLPLRLPPAALRRAERERRELQLAGEDECEVEQYLAEEDELLDVLKSIERHRDRLAADASYFDGLLISNPELQALWQKFMRAGGVTSRDFRQFLDGRFRCRRIKQRRHLRLVAAAEKTEGACRWWWG